jgi:hypothetical protein
MCVTRKESHTVFVFEKVIVLIRLGNIDFCWRFSLEHLAQNQVVEFRTS